MRRAIALLLVLALASAGAAAFLIDRRLGTPAPVVTADAPFPEPVTVPILVATRDLPSGTMIQPTDFRTAEWPGDSLPAAALRPGGVTTGSTMVRLPVARDTPILAGQVIERGAGGSLAYMLADGHVATALAVSETTGVAGHLAPGDRVDVLFTHAPSNALGAAFGATAATERAATETLLVGIKVLAMDQRVDDTTGEIRVARTATLEVTPKEAEMLALAQTIGNLSLALNSAAEPAPGASPKPLFIARRATVPSYTLDSEISALFRPAPVVEVAEDEVIPILAAVTAAAPAPAEPPLRTVTIVRGSSVQQIVQNAEEPAPDAAPSAAAPADAIAGPPTVLQIGPGGAAIGSDDLAQLPEMQP